MLSVSVHMVKELIHALYREFYSLVYIYFWCRPTPLFMSSALFIDHRLDYSSFETHDG